MRWRNVLFGLVILLLVVGAVVVNQSGDKEPVSRDDDQLNTEPIQPERDVKPQEGFAAPDFRLETLSGDTVRLYENNGKPSLINFWASWCPPCIEEMPHLQAAYDEYGDDVNFHMVDLAFNDNMDNMRQYIEDNNFTFPVPLDETGDVAKEYQTIAIPTTFIVDENGIITYRIQGAMTEQQIQSIMNDITK